MLTGYASGIINALFYLTRVPLLGHISASSTSNNSNYRPQIFGGIIKNIPKGNLIPPPQPTPHNSVSCPPKLPCPSTFPFCCWWGYIFQVDSRIKLFDRERTSISDENFGPDSQLQPLTAGAIKYVLNPLNQMKIDKPARKEVPTSSVTRKACIHSRSIAGGNAKPTSVHY